MNNAPAILRSLVTFAVIVPLAIFIGYLLANPMDTSSFVQAGVLGLVLVFPLLLRWHQPLLILSWNLNAILFFLPGRPDVWLAMAAVSLGISLVQRALGGVKQFISVPQVTWSLIFLIAVVVFTAKMTGLGLRSMGSEVYGGKRYVYLLGAIMGYFALSSRRIPPERATLYVAMFFLGGLTGFITDLTTIMPGPLQYIYLVFPFGASAAAAGDINAGPMRFAGAWYVSFAIFSYMLAKYGLRGIFLSGKSWRWVVFSLAPAYLLFGGFRGFVMFVAMMFALQFYLEGLHRTKLLLIFVGLGIVMAVLLIPLAPHLPGQYQRALAFLPLDIDPQIRQEAEGSLDWRVEMWKAVLPQVPQHLLLGKGYALSANDFQLLAGSDAAIRGVGNFAENQIMAVSGTYHNGPLSLVLTFGIWGVMAFVWFLAAGIWVLYRNWRYGDPALQRVNLFLLVAFVSRTIFFILIFGDIGSDMLSFSGFLGLGISLNGGVCRPAPEPVRETGKFQAFGGVRSHLQPTFRRH
jgi:hypothetical protein